MKGKGVSLFTQIFTIIFCVLSIVALVRLCVSRTDIMTFRGFLDMLHNAPTIQVAGIGNAFHVDGNWLVLEPIRWLINLFGTVVGFIMFIYSNAWNVLVFLWYLFANLFMF